MTGEAGSSSTGGSGTVATAAPEERPELLVAGAFVGGLALAFLLRQVAGD